MVGFTFLNIPVRIQVTFWIFFLIFTDILFAPSLGSILWGAILLLSILVHEYGHALTALYFGARPQISLEDIGGNASYNGIALTNWQNFLVVLNGPLFQSLLVFIPYYLLETNLFIHLPFFRYFFSMMMNLNIWLLLLNLIPIAPLDGSYLLGFVLEKFFGRRGEKLTLIVGLAAAGLAIPYLFYLGQSYFAVLIAFYSFRNYQLLRHLKSSSFEPNFFSLFIQATKAVEQGDFKTAKPLLLELVNGNDRHYTTLATELLGKIYYEENDFQKAYALLLKGDHKNYKEGKPLLCKLAYENQNYPLITTYAREAYTILPTLQIAIIISHAYAYLKDPNASGAWLYTASQFPTFDPSCLNHSAFQGIEKDPSFAPYLLKIRKLIN